MLQNLLSRIFIPITCGLTIFAVLLVAGPLPAQAARPNIVIISTDNMGWGDLCSNPAALELNQQLCGTGGPGTPNLDALAGDGVTMTNFHAPTPSCAPSRASLVTGLNARRHGVSNKSLFLSPSFETIADMLTDAYDTGVVGKWHLGNTPETLPGSRGFDYYDITPAGVAPNMYGLCFAKGRRDAQGNNILDSARYLVTHEFATKLIDGPCLEPNLGNSESFFWSATETQGKTLPDYLTDKALEFINRDHGVDTPFFLYLAYTTPHGPLDLDVPGGESVHDATRSACGLDVCGAGSCGSDIDLKTFCMNYTSCSGLSGTAKDNCVNACMEDKAVCIGDQQVQQFNPASSYYAEAIHEVDEGVGSLLSTLASIKATTQRDTIVLFFSDNGAWMGTQLEWYNESMDRKSTGGLRGGYPYLYEGGARVPFVARWTDGGWGSLGGNEHSAQLADMTDILPTLVRAAQGEPNTPEVKTPKAPIDGIDLGPVLGTPDGSADLKKDLYYYLFDARRYYTTPGAVFTDSYPYGIQVYDPVATALNSYKLMLGFDYSPKELYNLDGDLQEVSPLVSLDPSVVEPLGESSKEFLDSIGSSTQFFFPLLGYGLDADSDIDIDETKIFVKPRDLSEPVNVRVQFHGTDGSVQGFISFNLKIGRYLLDTLKDLCNTRSTLFSDPVPSCKTADSFRGSLAVFTDKPADVVLILEKDNKSSVVQPAVPANEHIFPKVYDGFTEELADGGNQYTNQLVVMNVNGAANDAIQVSWLPNQCPVGEEPPCPSIQTLSLQAYEKRVLRPDPTGGFRGMMKVASPTLPVAAMMKYEINPGLTASATHYQAPETQTDLYFPWIDDGGTKTNWVTIQNDAVNPVDADIWLYGYSPDETLGPYPVTVPKSGKTSFRPTLLSGRSAFQGAVKISGRNGALLRALTDAVVADGNKYFRGYDIHCAVEPSNVLVFPGVVDETGVLGSSVGKHSVVSVLNTTGETKNFQVTLILGTLDVSDCCARYYDMVDAPVTIPISSVPPNGRVLVRPSDYGSPFVGTVRVRAENASPDDEQAPVISGVVYSENLATTGSVSSINIQEAVPINPSVAAADDYSASQGICIGGGTVTLDVLWNDRPDPEANPGARIVSAYWASENPHGDVINRTGELEYTPPASYQVEDHFHYTIRTDEGEESEALVMVTFDTDGDGADDCTDGCPQDPNKTAAGPCGCGLPDDADGDGYSPLACLGTDCNDADPGVHPGAAEICGNGIDEDCSGAPDDGCVVPNCSNYTNKDVCNGNPACIWVGNTKNGSCQVRCNATENPEASCTDEIDNDCDGLVDGADPDCCLASEPGQELTCNDDLDNDCDGLTNCSDPDCTGNPACPGVLCSDQKTLEACAAYSYCEWVGSSKRGSCQTKATCTSTENPESSCADGIDNDCDGFTDCNDTVDCSGDPACQSGPCDSDTLCELGEDCLSCASDCKGVTGGKPASRYCCGNGVPEGPEGNGSICNNNF